MIPFLGQDRQTNSVIAFLDDVESKKERKEKNASSPYGHFGGDGHVPCVRRPKNHHCYLHSKLEKISRRVPNPGICIPISACPPLGCSEDITCACTRATRTREG